MRRRPLILFATMCALLVMVAVYGFLRMAALRDQAKAAAEDLGECRRMAERIRALSRRPQVAAEQERLSAETSRLIEEAAKSAGIPSGAILRITPGTPQRVADSAYKESPTRVLLKDVTLEQLVKLLHAVASDPDGLYPKSLRIAAPRKDDTGALWTAEIEVTYLIYAPLRTQKPRSL